MKWPFSMNISVMSGYDDITFISWTTFISSNLHFSFTVFSGYDDYMSFLCGINGSSPIVLNYTSHSCGMTTTNAIDLNLPSITISQLNQSRLVQRTVTNIADNETYIVGWTAPYGVSLKVKPTHFSIANGEKKVLNVFFSANMNNSTTSYGRIGLLGNKGHNVNIPLSVIAKIL